LNNKLKSSANNFFKKKLCVKNYTGKWLSGIEKNINKKQLYIDEYPQTLGAPYKRR
jgi:hypothetical protein